MKRISASQLLVAERTMMELEELATHLEFDMNCPILWNNTQTLIYVSRPSHRDQMVGVIFKYHPVEYPEENRNLDEKTLGLIGLMMMNMSEFGWDDMDPEEWRIQIGAIMGVGEVVPEWIDDIKPEEWEQVLWLAVRCEQWAS